MHMVAYSLYVQHKLVDLWELESMGRGMLAYTIDNILRNNTAPCCSSKAPSWHSCRQIKHAEEFPLTRNYWSGRQFGSVADGFFVDNTPRDDSPTHTYAW